MELKVQTQSSDKKEPRSSYHPNSLKFPIFNQSLLKKQPFLNYQKRQVFMSSIHSSPKKSLESSCDPMVSRIPNSGQFIQYSKSLKQFKNLNIYKHNNKDFSTLQPTPTHDQPSLPLVVAPGMKSNADRYFPYKIDESIDHSERSYGEALEMRMMMAQLDNMNRHSPR